MKLANDVKDFSYSLFDEYRSLYSSFIPQSGQSGDPMSIDPNEDDHIRGGSDYMKSLRDRAKRLKGTGRYVRGEFERYLNEQIGGRKKKWMYCLGGVLMGFAFRLFHAWHVAYKPSHYLMLHHRNPLLVREVIILIHLGVL